MNSFKAILRAKLLQLGTFLSENGFIPEPAPEEKLAKLKQWHFTAFADPHQPDCPRNISRGYRCNCVPPPTMWLAPMDIQVFMKDTYEDRRAMRRAIDDDD